MAPKTVGPGSTLPIATIAAIAVQAGFSRDSVTTVDVTVGPVTIPGATLPATPGGHPGGPSTVGGLAAIMTAIAMAESTGQTNVVSPTDDWGLWQINRPAWQGKLKSVNRAFDAEPLATSGSVTHPLTNGLAAHEVWLQQGTWAWSSTHVDETTGVAPYSKWFMPAAAAVAALPASVQPGGIDNPHGPEETTHEYWLGKLFAGEIDPGPFLWITGGVLVALLGVLIIVKQQAVPSLPKLRAVA